MNYRKFYENQYKVKLNKNFDIHHIDYNHNNNDITNLVALPKELHHRLHNAYNEYIQWCSNYSLDDIRLHTGALCSHTMFIESLTEYLNIVEECKVYMNKRNMGGNL